MARGAVFVADEIAAVYVMSRLVRPCFLMGNDSEAGRKNVTIGRRGLNRNSSGSPSSLVSICQRFRFF